MVNIIHYEEDIFYLTHTVKRLYDGLKLELDASLFLNKVLEDVAFVSRSIEFFLESLRSGRLKVNRMAHLKNVYKLNKLFIEMLNAVLTEQAVFAPQLKHHFPHLTTLRDRHTSHEEALSSMFTKGKHPEAQESDILSEEEYRILFSQNDEP